MNEADLDRMLRRLGNAGRSRPGNSLSDSVLDRLSGDDGALPASMFLAPSVFAIAASLVIVTAVICSAVLKRSLPHQEPPPLALFQSGGLDFSQQTP